MRILTFILIVCYSISCSDPPQPFLLPDNAVELIAGHSNKTWKLADRYNNGTRMNMVDCALTYRRSYSRDKTVSDNSSEYKNCGESLHATWELTKDDKGNNFIKKSSPQIPKLMNIEEDFKNFKILYISQDSLKLAYYHKQFSDKFTTIIDILVREDLELPNREFHW